MSFDPSIVGSPQDLLDQRALGIGVVVHVAPVAFGEVSLELLVRASIVS
jgi:hypothetical protein